MRLCGHHIVETQCNVVTLVAFILLNDYALAICNKRSERWT